MKLFYFYLNFFIMLVCHSYRSSVTKKIYRVTCLKKDTINILVKNVSRDKPKSLIEIRHSGQKWVFLKTLGENSDVNLVVGSNISSVSRIWSKPKDYYGQVHNLLGEIIKIFYVVKDRETGIRLLHDDRYRVLSNIMTKLNYVILQHLLNLVNATSLEIFKNLDVDMNKEANSGNFDIAGTPLRIFSENISEFNILGLTYQVDRKFIFRATPHSYTSNVFTLPFDSYVWYSCFGLMGIIFIIVYLVVYWEWNDPIFKRYIIPNISLRPDPVDVFLMEVGTAAQQGFEAEPRSNAGKIAFIFTLISFMFLYTSFSASIVALLQSTSENINSVDSLIKSRITIGFKENVSMDYFNDSKGLTYSDLQKPFFASLENGVRKLREDFFAFYTDSYEIYHYVNHWFLENEKCSLREIPIKNTIEHYDLLLRKSYKHKDSLRVGLCTLNERGIRTREYKRLVPRKSICDGIEGNFESVGLIDSYGAFMVMGSGLLCSFILFIIELLWLKYKTALENVTLNIE